MLAYDEQLTTFLYQGNCGASLGRAESESERETEYHRRVPSGKREKIYAKAEVSSEKTKRNGRKNGRRNGKNIFLEFFEFLEFTFSIFLLFFFSFISIDSYKFEPTKIRENIFSFPASLFPTSAIFFFRSS